MHTTTVVGDIIIVIHLYLTDENPCVSKFFFIFFLQFPPFLNFILKNNTKEKNKFSFVYVIETGKCAFGNTKIGNNQPQQFLKAKEKAEELKGKQAT